MLQNCQPSPTALVSITRAQSFTGLVIFKEFFMIKKLMKTMAIAATVLYAAFSFAAVDVNKATAAELESVKGVGPSISGKILDERKKSNFKDWNDMLSRISGIGEKSAAKLSANGLTVSGATFKGVAADAKADKKAEAKAEPKADAKADKKAEAKAEAKDAKK
jgi:competence protein ComEA